MKTSKCMVLGSMICVVATTGCNGVIDATTSSPISNNVGGQGGTGYGTSPAALVDATNALVANNHDAPILLGDATITKNDKPSHPVTFFKTDSHLRTANTVPTSILPAHNSRAVSTNGILSVTFSAPIDTATVNVATFNVRGEVSGSHAGYFYFEDGNTQLNFKLDVPFQPGEQVRVQVSDGIKDAAGASVLPWSSSFHTATMPSDGLFGPPHTIFDSQFALTVKAHDLNQDGLVDVAAAVKVDINSYVAISYAQPGGTFSPPVDVSWEIYNGCASGGSASYSFDVGDLNGDGKADLAGVVTGACRYVIVRLNDGSGGPSFLAPVRYSVPDAPDQISMEDLDGDGDLDLISSGGGIAGAGTPRVSVLMNQGDGSFAPSVQVPAGARVFGIAHIDIDHDGDADVLTANSSSNTFSVLTNDGYGVLTQTATYPVGVVPRDIVTPDLNGDGWADVVVANQGNGPTTITRYLNQGNGTFGQRSDDVTNGRPVGMDVGDIDGDQDLDIATANHYGGTYFPYQSVSLFRNNGAGFPRKDYQVTGVQPLDVAFGDFNGDGALDLLASNVSGGVNIVYNLAPNIIGETLVDLDESCSQNQVEDVPASNVLVKAVDEQDTTYYSYTDLNGVYAFSVPPDHTYAVSLASRQGNEPSCAYGVGNAFLKVVTPATFGQFGDVISLQNHCDAELGGDFTINAFCTSPSCTHTGRRTLCPCEAFEYTVAIENTGTVAMAANSTFNVQLPPDVRLCDINPGGGSTINATMTHAGGVQRDDVACGTCTTPNLYGGTVTITTGQGIPSGGAENITLMLVTANVPADCRDLTFNTSMTHWAGNPHCNVTEVLDHDAETELCCSYDPNDKKVVPKGGLCEAPVEAEDPLEYTIRFQNLGTAPAYGVVVRDLIDPSLDLESFRTLGSSHQITKTRILPNGEISWEFEGINLPDSTADMNGSMGWLQYRIYAKPNVSIGTFIDNTARIYFDANEPVITNTTVNQIEGSTSSAADFTYHQVSACTPGSSPLAYYIEYTGGVPGAHLAWTIGPDADGNSSSSSPLGFLVDFASAGDKTVTLDVTLDGCTVSKTSHIRADGNVALCP